MGCLRQELPDRGGRCGHGDRGPEPFSGLPFRSDAPAQHPPSPTWGRPMYGSDEVDGDGVQYGAARDRRERANDTINVCTMQSAPATTPGGYVAPAHDWKSLPQITKLEIDGSSMMWERAEKLDQWLDQIHIESAVVSTAFQSYTAWVIESATKLYDDYLTNPKEPLRVPISNGTSAQLEPRLAVLLARAIPDQVCNEARAIHK